MHPPPASRALSLLVSAALLTACGSWPGSRSDDAAPAPSAATAAQGTELGRTGDQTPPPLNASAGPAKQTAQATPTTQAEDAQCTQLRADIRTAQVSERAAPSTSINEDIVAASEAKADQKIASLQLQYDQLGCASEQLPPTHTRVPVLPPAPGALPP